MGIDYRAVVVVGVQKGTIENFDKYEALVDDGELETISPYYDGGSDDAAVVGLVYTTTDDYSPSEFRWNQQAVDKLKERFKELTGDDAEVWLSPYGY